MLSHPHNHMLIPAGGFRVDDGTWMTIDSDEFFLDEQKLADMYRDIYCKALRRKHRAGELEFPGELAHLADEETFLKWLAPIANRRWHIHTCQPEHVHRPGAALQYLSRYVAGSAISDVRIVSDIDGEVTIRIKDYQNGGQRKTLSMPGEEFVARFALHILPPHFFRVRYAGWLGNRFRTVKPREGTCCLECDCPQRGRAAAKRGRSRRIVEPPVRRHDVSLSQLRRGAAPMGRGAPGHRGMAAATQPKAAHGPGTKGTCRRQKAIYDKHDSPSTRGEDWLMGIPMSFTRTDSLGHKASPQRESETVRAEMTDFTPKTDSGPRAVQFMADSWRSMRVSISSTLGRAAEKPIDCHQSSMS